MENIHSFLAVLIPLLFIMDPIGNLPFFIMFTKNKSRPEQNRIALIASTTAALILCLFTLVGHLILKFFHISLPAFQLAGGLIFFIYALDMLGLIPSGLRTSNEEEQEGMEKQSVALVPLGTPLLAGPGAITAVMVWRNELGQAPLLLILLAVVPVACALVYLVFRFAGSITRTLGVGGIRVLTRLMGLLLAVIAVQYVMDGLKQVLAP